MRAREVNRRIERLSGFSIRQVGSHRRYVAEYIRSDGSSGRCSTTVAQHAGDVPAGTLRQIEKDMEPAFGKGWLQ